MKQEEFYKTLVQRYLQNKATEEELELFFHLMAQGKLESVLIEESNAEIGLSATKHAKIRSIAWRTIAAAVAVMLLSSILIYFSLSKESMMPPVAIQKVRKPANEILPGSEKAVLILADGGQINIDSATNGLLAKQGNVNVMLKDGQISYEGSGNQPSSVRYNSLITPRGAQYHLKLSDGTDVWLNAESSLRFPTSFEQSERIVELTGEGYFEVARNAKKPFVVKNGDALVKVLGTQFNVKGYEDEQDLKVTLFEGSVQVRKGEETALLKPGQQAKMNYPVLANKIELNYDADPEQVLAWKNGEFQFAGANIKEVMREISRWYNVEVIYELNTNQHFRGSISKRVEVSKVLKMLELTGAVKFEIVGKKIIVK